MNPGAQDLLPDWPLAAQPRPAVAGQPAAGAPLRIFIGSTWLDLRSERQAVEQALNRLRAARFVGMEYFGAQDTMTLATSLAELDRCDVYVGVIGHRYGSGITEAEYRRARNRGLPCLIYMKDGGDGEAVEPPEAAARQQALRTEMRAQLTVSSFDMPAELATRVVADLHNLLFDRLVVQGIAQLRTDYERRIRAFLAEYLGTPQQPIAFGGRDDELDALDRWFEDNAAPPYALVAGPAGRGKSALLVHWSRRLLRKTPDVALVFFPISIRFRTNLAAVAFASLTARLSTLQGEGLPGGLDTPTEVWRELMALALARPLPDGRRLLVVLDAADEAADWQPGPDLFPAHAPAGLRVLVSARTLAGDRESRGWLERLGWDRRGHAQALQLDPLTPLGLVQVLQRMSVPLEALSARTDIVAELYRLSEGDPLLVNLYVADLWSRGEAVARLQPEDLASIEPGLDGYFRRWWNDQRTLWGAQSPLREPAVHELLNTLACALGPLSTAELLQLMPPEVKLSVWELEDALRALQRFVIGDGAAQGYAFGHPRLGDHFYERLDQAGVAKAQELRFVEWGLAAVRALVAQRPAAGSVSTYVLQFLRRHMERLQIEPPMFMVLISTAWATAWERIDRGTFNGFIADLQAVHGVARREDERALSGRGHLPFIAEELRCAMCLSSIADLASGLSAAVLGALVTTHAWSPAQALAYASRMADPRQRLSTLVELTAAIAQTHRPLGVAAVVAELRLLVEGDGQSESIHAVLQAWSGADDSPLDREGGAHLALVLCQAALQLPPAPSEWLRGKVVSLLVDRGSRGRAPEVCVATLHEIQPLLTAEQALSASSAAEAVLRRLAQASQAQPQFAALRQRELRRRLHAGCSDPDAWLLTDALRAAVQVLLACARTAGGSQRAEVVALLLACERHLPVHERIAIVVDLADLWVETQASTFLTDLAQRGDAASTVVGVHALLAMLGACNPGSREGQRCTELLDAAVRGGSLPAATLCEVIERAGSHLGTSTCATALEQVEVQQPAHETIKWYARMQRLQPLVAQRAQMHRRALSLLRRLEGATLSLDALVGLLAVLERDGSGDSFESWRPDPSQCQLASPLRELLPHSDVAPGELADVGLALAARLLRAGRRAESEAVRQRLGALDAGAMPAPDEMAHDDTLDELLCAHYDGRLQIEPAMEVESGVATLDGLRAKVQLLNALSRWVGDEGLSGAAAKLTEGGRLWSLSADEMADLAANCARGLQRPAAREALALLDAVALEARTRGGADAEAFAARLRSLPMPDVARQELLRTQLRVLLRRPVAAVDIPRARQLLDDVCRLVHVDEATLDLSLFAFNATAMVDNRAELLARLSAHVGPGALARWTSALAGVPAADRAAPLTLMLERHAGNRAQFWPAVLGAVRQLRSQDLQAEMLRMFVPFADDVTRRELAAIARLIDGEAGLELQMLLAPSLDAAQGRDVQCLALTRARSMPLRAETAFALMRQVARPDADRQLVPEAMAIAIGLPKRAQRSAAISILAPVLSAEQIAAAAGALRQLDDGADRVRILRALVTAIADAPRREAAQAHVVTSLRKQLSGAVRATALFMLADWLPPSERWQVTDEALRGPRAQGFADEELMDAVAAHLPGAPAAVMRNAMRWLRKLEPTRHRTRTVVRLLPHLPVDLAAWALHLLADAADEEAIAAARRWVDDGTMDQVLRDSRGPADALVFLAGLVRGRGSRGAFQDESAWEQRSCNALRQEVAAHRGESARAQAIRRLAARDELPIDQRHALAQEVARIGDADLARSCRVYLAAFSGVPQLARRAVEQIDSLADRASVWTQLALAEPERSAENLGLALASVVQEPDPQVRARAAADIAIAVPECLPQVLQLLDGIDAETLLDTCHRVLVRLPDASAAKALETMAKALDETAWCWLLGTTAAKLGDRALAAALRAVRVCRHDALRSRVLVALSPRLADEYQSEATSQLDSISTDSAWLDALAALQARWPLVLDEARARDACRALPALDDGGHGIVRFVGAAVAWPPAARAELLGLAQRGNAATRGTVLHAVLRFGLASPWDELLQAAQQIDDSFVRATVLGHAAALRSPTDPDLHRQALRAARESGDGLDRLETLAAMVRAAGAVTPPVFEAMLSTYRRYGDDVLPAWLATAPWLDELQALQLAGELRAAALQFDYDTTPDLLLALIAQVRAEQRSELLRHVQRLCSQRQLERIIVGLSPWLDDPASLIWAFERALQLPRASAALICLLPKLDEWRQQQAVDRLAGATGEIDRMELLLSAVPFVGPAALARIFQHAERFRDAQRAQRLRDAATSSEERPKADAGDSAHGAVQALTTLLWAALEVPASAAARGRVAAHAVAPMPLLQRRLRTHEALSDRLDEFQRHRGKLPVGEQIAVAHQLLESAGAPAMLEALRRVVPLVPEHVPATWLDFVDRIAEAPDRAHAVALLAPRVEASGRNGLYLRLSSCLASAGSESRGTFLALTTTLIPVIGVLGGDEGLIGCVHAVTEMGELWP